MIHADRSHLNVVARSHPGMTGKNNEDRYAVSAFLTGEDDPTPSLLAVLSDGIGGHRAGEVAAEMAVEVISRRIAESAAQTPVATLRNAIVEASQQIYAHAQNDPDLEGMGGTCACVWVIGSRLYAGSVGDSRIYLLRGKAIRQLTTDHTWIQEALDNGMLKREDVRGHPNAHVIRRFLGSPTPPQVDQRLRLSAGEDDQQAEGNQGLRLHQGDRLLVCSDGLTDLVKDDEIRLTLSGNGDLEDAVQTLIDLACERGGYDNITLIALEVPPRLKAAAPPAGTPQKSRRAWLPWGCLGVVIAGLILALVLWNLGVLAIPRPLGVPGLPGIFGQPSASPTTDTLPTGLPGLPQATQPLPSPTPSFAFPSATPSLSTAEVEPTYTPWPTNTPITTP